jgi:hypothetical protein
MFNKLTSETWSFTLPDFTKNHLPSQNNQLYNTKAMTIKFTTDSHYLFLLGTTLIQYDLHSKKVVRDYSEDFITEKEKGFPPLHLLTVCPKNDHLFVSDYQGLIFQIEIKEKFRLVREICFRDAVKAGENTNVINSMLVSPDGQYLYVGAKYLRKYCVESGMLVGVLGESKTTSGVKWMEIDWKGQNLISVHYDGSVIRHQIDGKRVCEKYAPKEDTAVHWVEFIQ